MVIALECQSFPNSMHMAMVMLLNGMPIYAYGNGNAVKRDAYLPERTSI